MNALIFLNITFKDKYLPMFHFGRNASLLLLSSIILWSCSSSKKATKVQLDPVTVNASSSTYRATSDRLWDITHTVVSLSFNYKEKTADGVAIIMMQPYFRPMQTVVLDAKTMAIKNVQLKKEGGNIPLKHQYADDLLTINLDEKYEEGEKVSLIISYTAMPYAKPSGGSSAITDDRGLYFVNTDNSIPNKPSQIWTQGETQANSHWVPTIDKPNERFTTEIQLNVPDSFVTLSNGYLASQTKDGKGNRVDIWKMDMPIQPYAMMFAIGKFVKVDDDPWQGKPINYYVEPQYESSAKGIFKNTPEMIDYYSEITGVPYPWNKYSQIVVRDYVSGAMENTSASLFGEFVNATNKELKDEDNEDVVSHELFHQWFGDYVTAESWSNITLNESFANYGEQLWRKHKYGKVSADELAYNDLESYLYDKAAAPLVRYHYNSREDVFDRISYQKGGAILRYLHGIIGDKAFFRSMNLYLTKNALQPAEAVQWRLAVEEATGQDWNWFFNQWYFNGGCPEIEISQSYDATTDKTTVTIEQKQQNLYRLPVTVQLRNGQTLIEEEHDIEKRKEVFTFKGKGGFVFDSHHYLPAEIKYDYSDDEWVTFYKNLAEDDIISKLIALKALSKKKESLGDHMQNLFLKDNLSEIRREALYTLSGDDKGKYKNQLTETVYSIALHDADHKVRAEALEVLGVWKVEKAKDDYIKALDASTYIEQGSALYSLGKVDKKLAHDKAVELLKKENGGYLTTIIWEEIGNNGLAADTALFNDHIYTYSATKKIEFAAGMYRYLYHTNNNVAFTNTLNSFVELFKNEEIKRFRSSLFNYVFGLAANYSGKTKNKLDFEDEIQQYRAIKIKEVMNEMIRLETDEENVSTYKRLRKQIYG